ncbi:SusD/RagB family nutrient-binding outer membrane lipoprotein [Mucilaginibacter sp. E4BP6]|jgi:hypothetical protein|uniref:SusD/RagB family nutrient-binding outer membrane lipoprotein n=1 Tax=Mucilaginibacter sp. E4BP6 TaxID=2723089 RepID=UPI0015CA292E|nr:SusD/RagB family nutrient-binding outer membrane lipoprotein [Mucilaginibacter sp. E4BP6]NYE64364.1 hypothetical protein [Mucilaginibacter sp. E4BP6]
MKNNYWLLIFLLLGCFFSSCKKFSYYQINPNLPTQADPSLLLPNVEQIFFSTISVENEFSCRYLVNTEGADNSQYYGWSRGTFNYSNLSQVVKMEQEAARVNKPNYKYLGKFFSSYFIVGTTQMFGDVPYSQAELSLINNDFSAAASHPAYDKQEAIYLQVLNDLKLASDSLSDAGGLINNDLIYGGSVTQWKKAINSYYLRVLMSLSLHANDATLNIAQRFNDVVSNPTKYPLFASNADNAQLTYYDIAGSRYPYFNDSNSKIYYLMDNSFVQLLKGLQDPRLFVYAAPEASAAGLAPTNFNAYAGLQGSAVISVNQQQQSLGNGSQFNTRYYFEPANEPSVLMGYAELQFLLSEAVIRGWITGNANSYYIAGITAAMQFSDYNFPAAQGVPYTGQLYTNNDIQTYLSQPSIPLKTGTEIQQIITQKYISMFMNTGLQPFFENLRTGFPVFEVAGAGVVNQVNGVNAVPKRWMYPIDEIGNNATNVNNAIKSQYPGGDNINGVMWLLQQQ